jgi:hypothetical protein
MRHDYPPRQQYTLTVLDVQAAPGIKGLLILPFVQYAESYALDYCGNLADLLASRTLVSYWWRPDSPYSGHRGDCGRGQAGHGPEFVVGTDAIAGLLGTRLALAVDPGYTLTKSNNCGFVTV